MGESKNALEMGLMNIADVLYNIYLETNESKTILKNIYDALIENFKLFRLKPNKTVNDIPKQNKTFFKGVYDSIKSALTHNNIVGRSIKPDNYIENQNNVYFDKLPTDKVFKSGADFFDKLHRLALLGTDRLDKLTEFFRGFNDILVRIKPTVFQVGLGIAFLTASLVALNFVSLLSIMKLIVLLPAVGFSFGLFIGLITKAISGISFFKAFIVLHQIPAIFLAMGKSILFLSIGLLLFERVGWGALVKMGTAMLFLSTVFSAFLKGGVGADFFVLISLSVAVFVLAKVLKSLENIEWESIAKLSVFLMGLSFALNLFSMGKMGSSKTIEILSLSFGLIGISIALSAIGNLTWGGIFMLNTFIVGLGLALKMGGFNNLKMNPLSLIGVGVLALSLALLQMANVDVVSLIKVIGVIALLGFTIAKINGEKTFSLKPNMGGGSMLSFAFGLGLMALAMYALADVPITSMLKTVGFIVALGLALRVFSGNSKYSGLTGFAFGLGLMVLAILAFDELPLTAMLKTIGFVVALGLALRVFNGKHNGLLGFSFGLGIMVLALYAMNELPFSAMAMTIGFIIGIGLASKLITPTSLLTLLGFSAMILSMTYAFKTLSTANISWEQLAKFGVFVVGIGAIVALMGIPAISALIGLGSVVMIGLMGSVLLGALALKSIANVDVDYDKIWTFMKAVGTLALGFAVIAIPAVLGLVGAVLFIPIALSALLGAEALKLISNNEFNADNIDNFMYGVKALSLGFFSNGLSILGAIIPATAFIAIAGSAYLGAITLSKINSLSINLSKINNFKDSVKILAKLYDSFGIIQMGKNALKATAMLPILATTYLSALTLEKINKIDISKTKINNFSESFDTLITVMSDTIERQKDKLKDIKPALESVAEIVNISSKLAVVVQQMADMKFNEYKVVNGQLVLSSQRQLTETDFRNVGQNIGTLVRTLLEPIEQLGSNSSSFTIGNMVISNPFKSNKHLKGMDMIKRIGDAYLPLSESLKKLAESELYDIQKAQNMSVNMLTFVYTYSTIFDELNTSKYKNANKSISEILRFNELIGDIDLNTMEKFRNITSDLVTKLSDSVKWNSIKSNFTFMRKEVENMVKSINSLNLEKAKFFENNIRLLVDKGNSDKLADILELLRELIGLSVEHNQAVIAQYNQPQYNPTNVPNSPVQNTLVGVQPIQKNNEFDTQPLIDKLTEILESVSGVNQKLSGVLKVKNITPSGI